MSKIKVLPPQLIAKIAAGEVIERPAFVVKELIENAVDAGATHITVEIKKGGLESITVVDNGSGMSADDLFLAWQKHTTSKLAPDSDLTQIATLGFRGEALASMAAVSELTLQSRLKSEAIGNKVVIHHGKLIETTVVGMAAGTLVKVEHLFAGVPARQKFLGSANTEWHQCIKIIEAQALALPQIKFSVKHNGRVIFDVPTQTPAARLMAILGADVAAQSLLFSLDDPYAKITGFIGTPQLSFHTSIPSYFIVNQRVVKNKNLAQAIKASYKGLLKVEATPFFLLYVEVLPEMIDVNVHPRKEDIVFLNEPVLAQAIGREITAIANQHNLSFQWGTPKGDTNSFAAKAVRGEVQTSLQKIAPEDTVLQLHNLYLIAQTKEGVILIDQHAAHERVLYERLSASYVQLKQSQKAVRFTSAKKLSLPLSQMALVETHLPELTELGFQLVQTSPNTYDLHAVPSFFQDRQPLQLFQELLNDLEAGGETAPIDKHTNRMLSFLACRMAIKAGQPLDQTEIKKLIKELAETKTSYTCPHGRPTHLEISLPELEKMFGRTGF